MVRVKMCGKSARVLSVKRERGKPHWEQDRVAYTIIRFAVYENKREKYAGVLPREMVAS